MQPTAFGKTLHSGRPRDDLARTDQAYAEIQRLKDLGFRVADLEREIEQAEEVKATARRLAARGW